MKKINLVLCSIAFAGLGLTSCSNDDDSSNDVGIAGTYELKEFNTQNATDFNQDGTSNINQMEETNCYNNSKIVFNSDNTFTYSIKSILVNTTNGTSACAEEQVSGTWSATGTGTNAVITATYENSNANDVQLTLTKEGNELTNSVVLGQYPNRNEAGGAILSVGSVEMVFRK